MADVLEYSDIKADIKGGMASGRLKLTDTSIIFKNSKTGKVEQITATDIELANFQRFVGTFGLRLFLQNGTLYRYAGLRTGEEDRVAAFFKRHYSLDMLEKELSLKGWNWGNVNFTGSVLSFDCERKTSFEIPLHHVSQCTTGKNEVTIEFHQNDDAPASLIEMRMHIPTSESADSDPVEAFHQNVMKQASVISVSGDAIAIFREIPCLTPRGRYDIKIFQSFFQLHGKTFDYKIPMSTVLRLFLLPHKDQRQMFFVLSLDPPIKQGQTRYHYLVLLFAKDEKTTIELPFSEEELRTKYEGRLQKELSGRVYEVLGMIMKTLVNRKLTGTGEFTGHSGQAAIGCSYKAAAGYLYPLERGFIYVHKPPIHIRFEEIASVNFARSGGSTRSFDFEIETKQNTVHTFSSIEKEEYTKLFDYIVSKKIHVKNTGKNDKTNYKDDFGDSDNENEPDAYLARVKAEAKERDSDGGDDDSDESTDEDFNPDDKKHQRNATSATSGSDSDGDEDATGDDDDGEGDDDDEIDEDELNDVKKKSAEKPKKAAKEKSEKREKSSKKSKVKVAGQPKRATTAFMLWMNENRDRIKRKNPGIKVTEIAKKAGEMWRELTDKSEWEARAQKDKDRYAEEMKTFKASGAGDASAGSKNDSASGNGFKSKEYVSDDGDSDDGGSSKDKKKSKRPVDDEKSNKKRKTDTDEEDDDDDEEEAEEEESGDASD